MDIPSSRTNDEMVPDAAPPVALAERVGALLNAAPDGGQSLERHLDAAELAVGRLLRERCTSRAAALDLLAADALATYAFELASDTPDRIAELAAHAMARFAALGATTDPSEPDVP